MAYKFYNPNPLGLNAGDCVVRAITKALGIGWDEALLSLCAWSYEMKDMPSANRVWGKYLKDHGFSRTGIPDNCPDCYTVEDFCRDNPEGTFVLGTGTHVVCVADGDYYDSWDSGTKPIIYYYRRSQ